MRKIEVPDRLAEWPIRKPPARGSRKGPRNGPGRPAKRAFVENLPAAPVRECPSSTKKRPAAASNRVVGVVGQTRRCLGTGRKAASWKALAELYKPLPIDEFRDVEVGSRGVSKDTRRAAAMSKDRRSSPGGLAEEEDTRRTAAASRKTLGALRRILRRTRRTAAAAGARG
ncbi:hypothetical protein THAOC_31653 [Thalassiosira oceanica]|uniref:Uncharacterized protein n=1 Tax=Thalassiosira oceanica TaxID=159749 RepID=K0R8S7_THAOC|nr:hypothetical protein THAOC_31653 [Thalassiosira oceanica]|eukprot:EJK49470.1 hypothetical protein THAOC_31653 [Thalassiosira oceanica]